MNKKELRIKIKEIYEEIMHLIDQRYDFLCVNREYLDHACELFYSVDNKCSKSTLEEVLTELQEMYDYLDKDWDKHIAPMLEEE